MNTLLLYFIDFARLTLLLCVLFGWISYFIERFHVHSACAPLVTCASLTLAIYAASLLGLLLPMTLILASVGLIFGIKKCINLHRNPLPWERFSLFSLLFGIGTVIFLALLYRIQLVHYDNFTHWALMVKELCVTHALPTTDSVLIEFLNYPPGASLWIYFVCFIAGTGQNMMIFAQGLLVFACFYAIFGIINQKSRFLLYTILATGLSFLALLNISIRIDNLLVDFLLPMLTLAALAMVYILRDNLTGTLRTIAPVVGLLSIVKNTGLIYLAIILLYLLYTTVSCRRINTREQVVETEFAQIYRYDTFWWIILKFVCACTLYCVPYALWLFRVNTVLAGAENKFDVNVEQINSQFGGKTLAEVQEIIELFVKTSLDISQLATRGIVLFTVFAIVAAFVGKIILRKKWCIGKVTIAMLMVVALYYAGILAMYVFQMPADEALILAAFDRYTASVVMLFGGALAMAFTIDVENSFYYRVGEVPAARSFRSIETKNRYMQGIVGCMMALFLLLSSEYNGMLYNSTQYAQTFPYKMQQIVGDSWEEEVSDARYLVFATDSDAQMTSYYTHYVARYFLRANQVDCICAFYADNIYNLVENYDYLIIVETTEEEMQLMQDYFGFDGQVGVYPVQELFSNIETANLS